ncbi:MAG TPA: TIGR02466 family protein [Arenicellales bacterium]|nr:TIGR02466 family protein [Arenicellales bacterium]
MSTNQPGGAARPKQMSRDLFFPTQIYYTDLIDADEINRQLKESIYAWRDADPNGTFRTNVPQIGGWHSATDMHTRSEYDRLTHEIFELMQGVFDHLGYDRSYEPACDSMWANINPKYAYNRHHNHPHALWSGVYYVQVPDNAGLLYFSDPRPQAHVLTPYYDIERRKPDTWNEVYYQPQEGRLIVFPAWLMHGVQPNLSERDGRDGDRISISFNFRQRRRADAAEDVSLNEIVRDDLLARGS